MTACHQPRATKLTTGQLVFICCFWGVYAIFPIATGMWFHDNIDCAQISIRPGIWASAIKEGLSMLSYTAIPIAAWWARVRLQGKDDTFVFGWAIGAVVLAIATGSQTINKCW